MFEKASLNPQHETSIPLMDKDVSAEHSSAFPSTSESPIRKVDMNVFAERPPAPHKAPDDGYTEATKQEDTSGGFDAGKSISVEVPQASPESPIRKLSIKKFPDKEPVAPQAEAAPVVGASYSEMPNPSEKTPEKIVEEVSPAQDETMTERYVRDGMSRSDAEKLTRTSLRSEDLPVEAPQPSPESPIRKVDMNVFAENKPTIPVVPQAEAIPAVGASYSEMPSLAEKTPEKIVAEEIPQVQSAQSDREISETLPDRITDNVAPEMEGTGVPGPDSEDAEVSPESPTADPVQDPITLQGVDSKILFDGNDEDALGQAISTQGLDGGAQIASEGVQFNTNQTSEAAPVAPEGERVMAPEEVRGIEEQVAAAGVAQRAQEQAGVPTPGIEVQTGSVRRDLNETLTNTMPSVPLAESLQATTPEQSPRSLEGAFFNREQLETMISERLGLANNRAAEGMNNVLAQSQEFIRSISRNPELSRTILTASPALLDYLRGGIEKSPGTWSERLKKRRQKGRELLKRVLSLPGKALTEIGGMAKSGIEGIKSLAFLPVEKTTGLLNRMLAWRSAGRTKHFEAAEARKGELSPKKKEKLEKAKSKNATAAQLSALISNKA